MKTIDPTKTHEALQHKHDRPLTACRFDPTGRYVFFGAEDNLVHRFDLQTKAVTPLAAHDSWVRALGCSPDGKTLYTGGYDGRLISWPAAREGEAPAEPGAPIRTIEAHTGWLRALAVSPSGEKIATCGNDNLVKLWDAATGKLIAQCAGHSSHVYNVAFHPTGASVVSCDLKGNLKQWDVSTGALQRDLIPAAALYKYDTSFRADIGGARSIVFNSDGSQLALGGITNVTNAFAGIGNPVIELINMADGKLALQLEAQQKLNGVAWGVAHHPARAASDQSPAAPFWIALTGGGGGGWLYFFKDNAGASAASVGNALRGVPQSTTNDKTAKDADKKSDTAKTDTAKTDTAKDAPAKDSTNTANEFFKLKLPSDGRDLALSPDKTQVAVAHADKTLRLYALHEK